MKQSTSKLSLLRYLALALAALIACSSNGEENSADETVKNRNLPESSAVARPASAHEHESKPAIITKIVRLADYQNTAERVFSSVTQGIHEACLDAKRPGRIVALDVKLGEQVTEGQTLIRLDSTLERLAVDAASARKESTLAGKVQARRDLDRAKELFAESSISQSQLESVQLKYQVAVAAYDGAIAELGSANKSMQETRIVAPFAGEVSTLPYEVGETPAPGTTVAEVTDRSQLLADIFLTAEDLAAITIGMQAAIHFAGIQTESYTGTLRAISPRGDERTNLFKGEVIIDNSALTLRAGMTCRVSFGMRATESPVAPLSAIIENGQANGISTIAIGAPASSDGENDGLIVSLRRVTLGKRQGAGVVVLSGLAYGERVIVSAPETLKDGQLLRTIKEVPLDSLLN